MSRAFFMASVSDFIVCYIVRNSSESDPHSYEATKESTKKVQRRYKEGTKKVQRRYKASMEYQNFFWAFFATALILYLQYIYMYI